MRKLLGVLGGLAAAIGAVLLAAIYVRRAQAPGAGETPAGEREREEGAGDVAVSAIEAADLEGLSRAALYEYARMLGIDGRSKMNRSELLLAVGRRLASKGNPQ